MSEVNPVSGGAPTRDDGAAVVPGFSRDLSAGRFDYGLIRGPYTVVRIDQGRRVPVAEMVERYPGGNLMGSATDPVFHNPARENAFLFAAAPELYDACASALSQLRVIRALAGEETDATVIDLIGQLERAVAKALPSEPQATASAPKGRFCDYTIDDIDLDKEKGRTGG